MTKLGTVEAIRHDRIVRKSNQKAIAALVADEKRRADEVLAFFKRMGS